MSLLCTGLLPLLSLTAEELPPQVQVILQREPYADYAAAEVPLPPTEAQVGKLTRHLFLGRGCAMKQVLFKGMARTRAAGWRETEKNLAAMAREAESLPHAPKEFTAILKLQAKGNMSRPRAYALRNAREQMQQLYAVDELQMRLLLDYTEANETEAEKILPWLPLQAVFNMISQTPPERSQIIADLHLYADICQRTAEILSRVQSAEGAAAALPELKELLLLHDTTLPTRALLMQGRIHPDSPEMEAAATTLGKSTAPLREQRSRLNAQQWYGSKELKALDYLLN